MDKEFQTTFIPKKNLSQEAPQSPQSNTGVQPLSILSLVAGIFFFIGVVAVGGVFAYELLLERRIEGMRESLARAEKAFEPSLIIELQQLDRRLNAADNLLRQHIAVSPVFRVIEDVTLTSVKYDSFDYAFANGQADVSMAGLARDYKTVAEQSQILGRSQYANDHIFSNFSLNNQGQVVFNLDINFGSDLVLFENSLGRIPENLEQQEEFSAINQFLSEQSQGQASANPVESESVGIPSLDPLANDPSASTEGGVNQSN